MDMAQTVLVAAIVVTVTGLAALVAAYRALKRSEPQSEGLER